MKRLKEFIIEKFKLNSESIKTKYNYYPKTTNELKNLIKKLIKERGINADLNDIDTSKITNMNRMFYRSKFNGDIAEWDVNNVEYMRSMFRNSKFNGDISKWDVSNVKNMIDIFDNCPLEKNPPKWYKK